MVENEFDWTRWLDLLPLAVDLMSFAASVMLFRWVHRLTASREKLMARQLWHLALADSIESGMSLFWHALDPLHSFFGFGLEQSALLDNLCTVGIWNNLAFMTSLLLEVHIALATVAALYRFHDVLHALSRSVVYLWPAGFLMGVFVAIPSGAVWDTSVGACNTRKSAGEDFKATVMTVALCICILTYSAGFATARHRGGFSLQARIWDRAKFFVGAAMLSWCPFIVYTHLNNHGTIVGPAGMVAFYITFSLFLSNGLLNALVYALQSRFVSRAAKRTNNWSDPRTVQGDKPPSDDCKADRKDRQLNVGFRSIDSEWMVDATQEEALFNAERETAVLEKQRSFETAALANAEREDGFARAAIARSYQSREDSEPAGFRASVGAALGASFGYLARESSSSSVSIGSQASHRSVAEEELLACFDEDCEMPRSSSLSSVNSRNSFATPQTSDHRSTLRLAAESATELATIP